MGTVFVQVMVAQLLEIADKTFDYVVIGGGTAGLTVAGRLADDPTLHIAVLEAGEPLLNDTLINLSGQYAATWGNKKYDWDIQTIPQKHADGRACEWAIGKCLGGSSAMNFCVWSKPHARDADAWEKLGNSGWNWDLYQTYSQRSEHFTGPTPDQLLDFDHSVYNYSSSGTDGPVKTTIPWMHTTADKIFLDGHKDLGIGIAKDAFGGDNAGTYLFPNILDRDKKWTRSYAATAYYLPRKDNPNLKVLTEALVTRIIFSNEKDGDDLVATGVEYEVRGQKYVVHAKEVILSAGATLSPVILENSGIGQKKVLDRIGVSVLLDLPGVGENLQDHTYAAISYELKPRADITSFDTLRSIEHAKEQLRLQELNEKNAYQYGITAVSYLPLQKVSPDYAKSYSEAASSYVAKAKASGTLPTGRAEQYDLQLAALEDESMPDLQIVGYPGFITFLNSMPEPGKLYISLMAVGQRPLSRGSVHASSKDPRQATVDPQMFANPLDLDILVEGLRFARRVGQTEAFRSVVVKEVDPGVDFDSQEQLKAYIRKTAATVHHPIGTLSMMPREKNGCVDTKLKVFGTKNVRVCDVSVLPLHMSSHTQSAAYMIGEKLADLLKADRSAPVSK